ncbi:MAG: S46 family peptidase [Bacteroidales bacterium]|nr:S46 family peptidase [Bacteroidales bacterium]MDD4670595.1 S46 family peptidase [Bacteroidales bacterium]
MKKITLLFSLAFLLILTPARADEGMWLLPLLEKMNIKTMQKMGLQLTAEDIYSINHSSLKDAVVHFGGGCTGEIISAEGLLVTNHHCGYGSIRKLSTVEHDYLTNGYWAMNRNEELPAEGLTVTFLESFTDVTKTIEKALRKADDQHVKDSLFRSISSELVLKAVGNNQFLNANVYSMYGGNAYYLVVSKTYKDVRFVGAPPSSIGKFGADTDNWMWPRHTCDFSMFRVYADKDNNPADYSADNVPYKPKQHLTISLKGVKPNDFTFIMGYPGRTNRFMTQSELVETRDITNAISIYTRGIRQELMMEDMLASPKVKIQYASKYSGSSNGWKKWIGMNETFAKLNVEQRRAQEEAEFTKWVSEKKSRQKQYGEALNKINSAIADRKDATYVNRYLSETLNNAEIASIAFYINRYYQALQRAASPADKKQLEQDIRDLIDAFYTDYSAPTDRKIIKSMIKIYRDKVSADYHPSFYQEINEKFGGNIDRYVDNMFDNSIFASKEKLLNVINAPKQESADETAFAANPIQDDPALKYSLSYRKIVPALRNKIAASQNDFYEGKKQYIAGQLEMRKGTAIYPDANSSMRLTYGTVLPYSPKDAVVYNYYTTLDGVMEKEDPDNWEFIVPEKLKELHAAKDYGRYAMSNGQMPACFITNGDITGGNSGSPVLNAKGELIGLAFDGNWEAMSGDIIFEPELQRCINVDIRYVLFIVDKFGGAGYLLDEMTISE